MIETILQFKYLIFAAFLIFLDKFITVLTIKNVAKKYPDKDKYSVERNPLASYFFKEFGLGFGSLLYGILSFFSFNFSVWLLSFVLSQRISYIILCVIYVLVIINNIKWFLRYRK